MTMTFERVYSMAGSNFIDPSVLSTSSVRQSCQIGFGIIGQVLIVPFL
jgi:hypothetical protein